MKKNATIWLALQAPNNGLYFRRMQLLVPACSFVNCTQNTDSSHKQMAIFCPRNTHWILGRGGSANHGIWKVPHMDTRQLVTWRQHYRSAIKGRTERSGCLHSGKAFQGQVLNLRSVFRDRYCNNLTVTAKTGELLDVQKNKVADNRISAGWHVIATALAVLQVTLTYLLENRMNYSAGYRLYCSLTVRSCTNKQPSGFLGAVWSAYR